MKNIITLLIIITLVSCKKKTEPAVCNPIPPIVESEIIWQLPVFSDTAKCRVKKILAKNGDIIFDAISYSEDDTGNFQSVNIDSGTTNWLSNEHTLDHYDCFGNFYIWDDKIVSHDRGYVESISLNTGSRVWSHHIEWGEPYGGAHGKNLYVGSINASFFNQTKAFIWGINMSTGFKEKVCEVDMENDWRPTVNGRTAQSALPNGDEIIYFCSNYLSEELNFQGKVNFRAYNKTMDTVLFQIDSLGSFGTVFSPVISGDKVYLSTAHKIYCLSKNTGEIIWHNVYSDGQHTSSELGIKNNRLIFKNGHGKMRCLNSETGQELWVREDVGGGNGYFSFYNDKVIFIGDKLYVIDIMTGATIKDYTTPMRGVISDAYYDSFSTVGIDETQGLMFPNDGYFIYCIKIPE